MERNSGWNSILMAVAVAAAVTPSAAWAQAEGDEVVFHVSSGALDTTLTRIAAQSGHRIVFDPVLVAGKTAPPVEGRMLPEAAVRLALSTSGLTLRVTSDGQWIIAGQAPSDASVTGGRTLSTVRVTSSVGHAGSYGGTEFGANGSTDPVSTEGTRSYTTNGAIVASKMPLALKDTPQAISVLTRQQLDDRSINSFSDAMKALPGVTTSVDSSGNAVLSSRGFVINSIQIDGGSPIFTGSNSNYSSQYRQLDDLSIYDSVTIERGAAGTFTGVGNPGGTLSLERKRPLDHEMLDVTAQVGSWDRYRGVVDVSSPVLLNGLVKARAVATVERNGFFYDYAKRAFAQGYINVEIAPAADTTINIGGKISHERNTPFQGIPVDPNGNLLYVPRATCLCTPWSRSITNTKEVFVQLRQAIGDDWTLRLNTGATYQDGDDDSFVFNVPFGKYGVQPGATNQGSAGAYRSTRRSNQYVADAYIAGKFDVLGAGIELTVGGNFQKVTQRLPDLTGSASYSNYVVIPFDAANFPRLPDSAFSTSGGIYSPLSYQRQYGVYGTIRISPSSWLHLTIADRFTAYDFKVISISGGRTTLKTTSYSNFSPPNAGLVADLSKEVSLFANYNSIFDQQNLYQKDGSVVKPTTGVNIEGGAKAALAHGTLNLSGSVFYIEQRNVPARDRSVPLVASNSINGSGCCYLDDGTKYISRGFEFQAQGAITRRVQADVSYTYTNFSKHEGPTAQLSDLFSLELPLAQPKHLVKIFGTWQLPVLDHRMTVGLGGQGDTGVTSVYPGPRRLTNGIFAVTSLLTHRPGYVTADALLRFAITPKLSAQVNITNIFDRTYYAVVTPPTVDFYGQPRAALFTLRQAL
ncbi:TonB-dependent siderophore receptor [Sphingomonas sp. 22176]|uniref:TonB-dependent siderophore receptor n=1 Tax=Sphingomonas sp. 22176 TaxID=3453884 RepID=UPI003F830E7F